VYHRRPEGFLTKGSRSPVSQRDKNLKKDPKALLREAQRLREKADRLEQNMLREVASLRREAAGWEDAAKTVLAAKELPSDRNVRTLPRVEARTVRTDETRRPGAPLLSDHPFAIALESVGLTAAAWGKKHGLSEEKVRSWYRRVDPRRVPRKYAAMVEREFGLPVDETTWPNGIRG
jgi:hypothetical protein